MLNSAGKRSITTHNLLQGQDTRTRSIKKMLDIQGTLQGSMGVLRLNREHRMNTLTPNFIKQIKRGVETMNLDHSVKLIYLAPAEGKHFSNGTDFRTIMHYQANGESDKITEYLGGLFDLQATFAKINKPIMTIAPGHSYNSGAGLLAASGIPSICEDSSIAFNECTFGFVPHAGSCYYTSRLPGDMGTFLALTGLPMTGKDAIKLGVADSLIELPKTYEHEAADIMISMDPSNLHTARQHRAAEHSGIHEHKQVEENVLEQQSFLYDQKAARHYELQRRMGEYNHDEPFVDPRSRSIDVVAEADIKYEEMLERHAQSNYGTGGATYWNHEHTALNFFAEMQSYVKLHNGEMFNQEVLKSLQNHQKMIDRCFYPNSVEEIMENLRQEQNPFAKEILTRMEANSMLSMKIALKMLRQAKNMDYGQVLKMELNAALNKVKDSDFELGVSQILMKQPKKERVNPGFQSEVSDALVESYFQPNPSTNQIDLQIVENSLLPTRHFFEKFTDSLRVWINETSTPQEEVREAIEYEIKDALRVQGINILDKTLTIPQAREAIYKKIALDRKDEEFIRRSTQMATDMQLRGKYMQQVMKEVEGLENKEVFSGKVNSMISNIFQEAYLQRLNTVYEKSKEAHSLEKRRMFIRLKKFMMKSRLLTFLGEETERMNKQIDSLPFKQMHLTEGFSQSRFDVEHPEIQQSVMYHLRNVVGKANLTPQFMLKEYLTDPETAKSMQSYVFDKSELEKLQKDILENPNKYEEMLNQERHNANEINFDHGGFWESKRERAKTRENWYRMYNDGNCKNLENWPMTVEYYSYKRWADQIQDKALDTLRFTVSRLLLDFESNPEDLGNKVQDFEKGEKESKLDAIMRLHNMLETSETAEAAPQEKKSARNIKTDFYSLIEEDKELSKIFKAGKKDNQLINSMRDDLLKELLQLVETVLIDQNKDVKPQVLQKRLDDILNPKIDGQLKFIDSFLQERNSKDVLKKAIDLCKPFYFKLMNDKIEHESAKLLTGMRYQENKLKVMEHYMVNKKYPELQNEGLFAKLEEKAMFASNKWPKETVREEENAHFYRRQLVGAMGSNAAVTDQEAQLAESTYSQLKALRDFEKTQTDLESQKQEKLQKSREDELRLPFDQNKSDKIFQKLDPADQLELNLLEQKIEEVRNKIQTHRYEIDTSLGAADWLKMYSTAILEQNMEMDHVIHETRNQRKYADDLLSSDSQIEILNNKYNLKNGDWQVYGEYSGFLEGLNTAQSDFVQQPDQIIEFMALHDHQQSSITRESIFKSLIAPKSEAKAANLQIDEKIAERQQLSNEILNLAQFASPEVKDQVRLLVNSKHAKLDAIKSHLAGNAKGEFNVNHFIDSRSLLRDVNQESGLQSIMKNYRDINLDVVSIAEISQMLNSNEKRAVPLEAVNQMKVLLDHINGELKHVSNTRRSQLTLGTYLAKVHNGAGQYSNDMLKSQIENALGSRSNQSEQQVLSELNGISAHPAGLQDNKEILPQQIFNISKGAQTDSSVDSEGVLQSVFQSAIKSIGLSQQMESVRNGYENMLLQEYAKSDMNKNEIERLVQEYTQIRINDCLLKTDFATQLKTENGPLYMKLLRERILDELKLGGQSASIQDIRLDNHVSSMHKEATTHIHLDPAAKYNLNHLNNEEAIGYNNLLERASNPENNSELAHTSVFDKMMADYFLDKRRDYKSSNKLIRDLEQQFGMHEEHPMGKASQSEVDYKTLGEHHIRQSWDKSDTPDLEPYNLPALMDLDIAVNRQLNNGMAALSQENRDLSSKDSIIPPYFEVNDVRKPADLYVEDQLQQIIQNLFDARQNLEKHLTRGELIAYDKVLTKYLQYDELMPKLKREISKEFNSFDQQNQMFDHYEDDKINQEKQTYKTRNQQAEFNKGVINEDSFYKFLAYSGSLEKQRSENRAGTMQDPTIYAGYDGFDQFYQDKLIEEAKQEPRKIDYEALKPKLYADESEQAVFSTTQDKSDMYLENHKKYKENKLEQQQRIELFYVLEQMNQKDNQLEKASDHIHDYFSDPSNTFFYEKNKIN